MSVVPSSNPINGTNRLLHNRCSAFPTQPLVLRQTSEKYGLLGAIAVCIRPSVPFVYSWCADVGGGSVRNYTRHSLARIPLRWMVREIFKANPGILFLTDRLPRIGLDPSTVYPSVLPRPEPLRVGKEHKIRNPCPSEMPIRYPIFMRQPMVKEPRLAPMLASEEHEELKDALSPIYDQMSIRRWWWLLELVPLPLRRVWHGQSTTRLRYDFPLLSHC
jgi:hypothetical protein